MSKKNAPEKTRQRTLAFVAVFVGFLGTSIFAGINVFAAHQKNQDFSQLDAEEKFSRLPEYLLVDRSLLKDRNWDVRNSAAKALGELRSKEAIPELISLLKESLKESRDYQSYISCSVEKALNQLESMPQSISLIEESDDVFSRDNFCIGKFGEFLADEKIRELLSKEAMGSSVKQDTSDQTKQYNQASTSLIPRQPHRIKRIPKEAIPQLTELLTLPDIYMKRSVARVLIRMQAKEAIPELIIEYNKSNGIEQYKILEALIALDGLNESQIREAMLKVIKELEGFNDFVDSEKKSSAIDLSTKIYLKFNQKFKGYRVKSFSINKSRQMRDSQWILTGSALAISSFLLLLTLFSLRQLHRISWQGHLICYFPKEVVSELIAFRRELTQSKKPTILIEITLLYVVFTLIWAFYVQINIENLWLPSKDQRRR
jgi:PBS lyase HEAT-like repeat